MIFTARKRSLGQGNIFTSMCHSFCPQGGVCLRGGVPPTGGSASRRGVCIQGRGWTDPPPPIGYYGMKKLDCMVMMNNYSLKHRNKIVRKFRKLNYPSHNKFFGVAIIDTPLPSSLYYFPFFLRKFGKI